MDFEKSESYGDQMCKAIEIIVNKKMKKIKRDKTVEGVVEAKTENGQYRVKIKNSSYTAFSINPFLNFQVGDTVLILIPKGDFSYKKIIIDLASKEKSCEILLPNIINVLDGKKVSWQKTIIDGEEVFVLIGEDILIEDAEPSATMLNGKYVKWKKIKIDGQESFVLTGEDLPNL